MQLRVIVAVLALAALSLGRLGAPAYSQGTVLLLGRVFEDLNGNKIRDPQEPCVDARVTLRPAAGGAEKTDSVTCGQKELYQFPDASPGDYILTVIPASTADFDPATFSVSIPAGTDEVRRDLPLTRRHAGIAGQALIDRDGNGQVSAGDVPVPNLVVRLFNATSGAQVSEVQTNSDGNYFFAAPPAAGSYLIQSEPPSGLSLLRAIPGPNAQSFIGGTILISGLRTDQLYSGNNFLFAGSVAAGPTVQRLLTVGARVDKSGGLGLFGIDPPGHDRDVSLIRRAADDGSVYVLDYAGAALFRLKGGKREILLDTTAEDPEDQVALARLLRVEVSGNGVSGIAALRADERRGIYRLDGDRLTRLALLPDDPSPAELTLSDDGQLFYVAPVTAAAASPFGLFRAARGQPGELLLQGRGTEQLSDLTVNSGGDLAILITDHLGDGTLIQQVLRILKGRFDSVAQTGDNVRRGSDQPSGVLTAIHRPRIGPDGTVVFQGSGSGFVNFYVLGSGRPLQPMLKNSDWNPDGETFDYEIAADGTVALLAAEGASTSSGLYVVSPQGGYDQIAKQTDSIQPVGHPVFGPPEQANKLFFLARNIEGPRDRTNQFPVVLCRSLVVNGHLQLDPDDKVPAIAVAAPFLPPAQQPIPTKPAAQLLTLTQRPMISGGKVVFEALFGGTNGLPVPTAGLFQAPLDSKILKGAELLATEGDELPGADHVALFRDLSYAADGTLMFNALLPGGGPLVGLVTPGAATASVVHTQALQAATPGALLLCGDDLGGGRRFLAGPSRLISLTGDQQLLIARYADANGKTGEGLFRIGRNGQPLALAAKEEVAVPADPAQHLGRSLFDAFGEVPTGGDPRGYSYYLPAIATDGRVVFKAELTGDPVNSEGVFQSNGSGGPARIALAGDAFVAADARPYTLEHWGVDSTGRVLLQVRAHSGQTRLLQQRGAGSAPNALDPVPGASALSDFYDFLPFDEAAPGKGGIYVHGRDATGLGLFRLGQSTPVVREGAPLPLSLNGNPVSGTFNLDARWVRLLSSSPRGGVSFLAGVHLSPTTTVQGLFGLDPGSGRLWTVLVEGVVTDQARSVAVGTLALGTIYQSKGGTTVWADQDKRGMWELARSQPVRDSTGALVLDGRGNVQFQTAVLVRETASPQTATDVVSLDPGRDPGLPSHAGPVFTLNEKGDVAFLASDGKHWGIYQFSGAVP